MQSQLKRFQTGSNIIPTSVVAVCQTKMQSTIVFERKNVCNMVICLIDRLQTRRRHYFCSLMIKLIFKNGQNGHACIWVVHIHYVVTIYFEENDIM